MPETRNLLPELRIYHDQKCASEHPRPFFHKMHAGMILMSPSKDRKDVKKSGSEGESRAVKDT